ncbi:MAG: DUF493 domain-containing protein [Flavobacteriaceae bacterium]|jgi:putative lipoic acid-binding regulatory protein|nr:DUF493 domain-containing protein [Flavobacteriaceae bacterium]
MEKSDKIEDSKNNERNQEVFYSGFKEKLDKEHHFPGNYTFKFIIPTENKKIAQLHKIFDHSSASFSTKESKQKKYTGVTITLYVTDSTSVIEYYKEASEIEDIVML